MKINLLTLGTRGDVQPFVALGMKLREAGHAVTVITAENFKPFVERHGLFCSPIRARFLDLAQSEEGKQMLGGNPLAIMRNLKKFMYPMMEQMLADLWAASQEAEALIFHPKALGGADIAEKLDIPVFAAHPVPLLMPTSRFANPALPLDTGMGWLNRMSYSMNRLISAPFLNLLNRWRRETLGLPARRLFTPDLRINGRDIPVLYGCSPAVVPYDPRWEDRVCMAGFWYLPETDPWQAPQQLAAFLSQGPAPLAISFSSMPLKQPERILAMMTAALQRSGQRGIILTGGSGMQAEKPLDDVSLFLIESAPHDWLFPRTTGIIHHGGAGTTASALRAGKPMLVCPFVGDQPFWARRMRQLGAAAAPLREKEMTVDTLTARLQELARNESLSRNAHTLAQSIRQEDGLEHALQFIHRKLEQFRRR
ncbi:MAG: glycosyltransferase [Paenibacillus dendritiformis]|uniref:glycosyltransferase n=1 Tax=uncultured Paenibacillus sp. TaxID=227322 RepID=UPI0025DEB00A|nr:glycosyltransferase [uncultured Paenibacillus sp.]MDU5145140.1 glycosyltransferase [Paenibacillus dendritiformis]